MLDHEAGRDEVGQEVLAVVAEPAGLATELVEGVQQGLGPVEEHLGGDEVALRLVGLVSKSVTRPESSTCTTEKELGSSSTRVVTTVMSASEVVCVAITSRKSRV